ncbi:hypothetical protein SETIT_7G009900v2 [Setaria italica]|uniref:Uncharacterized protein n=1 Tax=Setaria italica TaxID=4555 RepID=K3YC05_SETIT|nr:uncharacterized protein LOC101768872 [Setaria italica]XP_004977703.1 uncharacterized protein LOC101769286 [Setaria italica]XP_004977704.1 uncharacterized protein LOC101769693 [Setaria italica]RCV32520.1 hypothetical protein SETIT_7G009700v2 [Setaria italica]RCV32521.1 hypothetical protein SETIT_7G009800v2 [Setaria italica]RCV32522.1 hypothetical protein SETIT_7G009900v2 [Setaria italica]
MAKQHLLLVVLVASILHATASSLETTSSASNSTVAAAASTVYDVLEQNNLPRGLLPQGVQSYVLHDGGALEVTLPGECNFFVSVAGKRFHFRYGSSVAGVIQSGSISRVSGVRVQAGFAWLGFNQVQRAGDQLNIQLEKSTQSFPVSAFAQSPRCS